MSLLQWLYNGRVVPHESSAAEVRDLVSAIDRDLRDSGIEALSTDARLSIAYNAAILSALLALAAAGYRQGRERHHERAIASLEFTVCSDAATVRRLQAFRRKRNTSDYDRAGSTSEAEAAEMRTLAEGLSARVRAWLAASHSELLS